jgi:hypothetical protein
VWRRLLTVSSEDCWGILTAEVKALHDSYMEINRHVPSRTPKGRIFISKTVILLCAAKKNRDADHLQNFVVRLGAFLGFFDFLHYFCANFFINC